MKNVLKRFGNLTQARSAKVPLVIIALVAVIGFSFAACGGDSGGGGDDPSPYLGDTVTISGEQVYMWNESEKLIKFEDNLTIKDTGGGKGAIANGKLTFTIGTPPVGVLKNIKDIFNWGLEDEDEYYFDGYYNNIKYEPSDAQCFLLRLNISGSSDYSYVDRGDVSGSDKKGWEEIVDYVYVDKDVTITGKGTTGSHGNGDDESDWTTKDFNLPLKKGWNAMYWKSSWEGTTETETMSLRNPKNSKWFLVRNDND